MRRIACIGNMNNNNFALVRFLRDEGYEADLLRLSNETLPELQHFHPCADTFDPRPLEWCRDLDWGNMDTLARVTPQQIRHDLGGYDVLLGCGAAPAFLHKAGLKLDIFLSYGSDLFELPFYSPKDEFTPDFEDTQGATHLSVPPFVLSHSNPQQMSMVLWLRYHRAQAQGIASSSHVVSRHPRTDAILTKLGFTGRRLQCDQPIIYTPHFNPDAIVGQQRLSPLYETMAGLRRRHSLLVFHHARHIWHSQVDAYSAKGNDILVRGFASFVSTPAGAEAGLVMAEYGPDVGHTRALVDQLGITDRVSWVPLMARRDIMVCLGMADVAASEFTHGWLTGGCIFEPLAMGRPLLGYRDDDRYRDDYPELYPMLNAATPEQVAQALARCVADPEWAAAIGESGRRWFETYIIRKSLHSIIEAFDSPRPPR